ncbi:hypothetical protein B0H63DRAFT_51871 [Podospora didyma]|uniref:Uncharacterized protein n=1 Tax=Podospora didyma TaxID=330526 RepID=A0AAE0P779_9PEZI|nr:hypothetical protein B0H63DRAFT_51871 [Podospora didyma]
MVTTTAPVITATTHVYHCSNTDGSYYYSNPNGSTYPITAPEARHTPRQAVPSLSLATGRSLHPGQVAAMETPEKTELSQVADNHRRGRLCIQVLVGIRGTILILFSRSFPQLFLPPHLHFQQQLGFCRITRRAYIVSSYPRKMNCKRFATNHRVRAVHLDQLVSLCWLVTFPRIAPDRRPHLHHEIKLGTSVICRTLSPYKYYPSPCSHVSSFLSFPFFFRFLFCMVHQSQHALLTCVSFLT